MKILVHDFAGHPFQVQLSREMARRGHEVLHAYCASYTGGKGSMSRSDDDASGFDIRAIDLGADFAKYSPVKRFRQEREYGRAVADAARAFAPHVVISGNTPLLAQQALIRACNERRTPFVFWQQDVVGVAMQKIAARKLPVLGGALGSIFPRFERGLLRRADAVVAITQDFIPLLAGWGIPSERSFVIENWAPLEELPQSPRDNEWARANGLAGKTVILYAGTLGLKHNPDLIVELAREYRTRDEVAVVVVSEGVGADHIAERARSEGLTGVKILPFQPYEVLAQVLGSADVLVVILEPDAGVFSVPSKVLSYLCAGRAILGAIPPANLAARIIERSGAGVVASPGDPIAFVAAARGLMEDASIREAMAGAARAYAKDAFDIANVGDRFEAVFEFAVGSPRIAAR